MSISAARRERQRRRSVSVVSGCAHVRPDSRAGPVSVSLSLPLGSV